MKDGTHSGLLLEFGRHIQNLDMKLLGSPRTRRLRIWPLALGGVLRDLRSRAREASEQLMLAEYYIEQEPGEASIKALACIARAKGLLGCMMLAGMLWISCADTGHDMSKAKTRTRVRTKEEQQVS